MKNIVHFYLILKSSLRMLISFHVKKVKMLFSSQPYVLSRTACLGNDIQTAAFKADIIKINFQKSRVDHLVENKEKKIPLINAFKQIIRMDIWPFIFMQSQCFFAFNKKPECIVLDSYSELTDQKFTMVRKDKFFFANYSDVNLEMANNKFQSQGLICLDELYAFYTKLFELLTRNYGKETPIFFIHFQTELDPRDKFKARSAYILNIIEQIVAEANFNLFSISINNNDVSQADNDNFYYHYSEDTYDKYIKEFVKVLKTTNPDKYNRLINITEPDF